MTFRTLLAGKLSPIGKPRELPLNPGETNCTKKTIQRVIDSGSRHHNSWALFIFTYQPNVRQLKSRVDLSASKESADLSTFFQRVVTRRDFWGLFWKKNPQVSMAMMALKFSFFGNTTTDSNKNRRGKFTNVAGCRSPSNVPPHVQLNWKWLVHLGLEIGTFEPRKKKPSSFPLHWLFNRDPYFMVYEIIRV